MGNRAPEKESTHPELPVIIALDLSRHCIQTAVRRRYETLVAAYFKTESGQGDLEMQIGLLQQALETLDFAVLRSRWPELAGGRAVKVAMGRSAGGIVIHTGGGTIAAPLREKEAGRPANPEEG
jgi:hypothetical protein